jgi:hypothetical protein
MQITAAERTELNSWIVSLVSAYRLENLVVGDETTKAAPYARELASIFIY